MRMDEGNTWEFREGLTRESRKIEALQPDSVAIGGWAAGDLTSFCLQFAQLLWYYDHNDEPDGDWQEFLKQDPSIFLSQIYRTNLDAIGNQRMAFFRNILDSADDQDKRESISKSLNFIMSLADKLQNWSQQALVLNLPELSFELDNALDYRLRDSFTLLMKWQAETSEDDNSVALTKIFTSTLQSEWGVSHDDVMGDDGLDDSAKPLLDQATPDIINQLNNLFDSFYQVYVYIINLIPAMVYESIENNSSHKPHVGVLFAFVDLYLKLQEEQNQLSKRHLDFYFKTILDQQLAKGQADKAYVSFALRKGAESTWIPKGTLLAAGKDAEGNEVSFATTRDLLVNQAVVSDVRTLTMASNFFIQPLHQEGMTTALYGAIIDPKKVAVNEGWAPFGENFHERRSLDGITPACDLGWVISTPVLRLENGIRKVNIILKMEPESFQQMLDKMQDMSEKSDYSLAFITKHFFSTTFDLYYTSAKSWEHIPVYRMGLPRQVKNAISIEFILPASAPPITAFTGKAKEVYEKSKDPCLRMMLNQRSVYFPYSLIQELCLEKVEIKVDVQQVDQLQLYNDVGKITTGAPFSMFGPNPIKGSSFYFGYPEIFGKKLTDLDVNIKWMNLPESAGGLTTYYQTYNQGISNTSFTANLSVLTNYIWTPESSLQQCFPLFTTYEEKDDIYLHKETTLEGVRIGLLKYDFISGLEVNEKFSSLLQTGFFRLSLSNPEMAFGADVYPEVLTRSAIENIKNKGKEDPVIVPKPFEPKVSSISLDYKAKQVIEVSSGTGKKSAYNTRAEIYHIHPFGSHQVYQNGRLKEDYWFPHYGGHGYLYLGLENVEAGESVSLYFEMASVPSSLAGTPELPVTWQYLQQDSWIELPLEKVLLESTKGFQNSGIVKLQLPDDITNDNSLMPPEKFWFRAVIQSAGKQIGNVLHLATQGMEVVRTGAINSIKAPEIAAGVITKPKQKIPALDPVKQPYPSFGGGGAETSMQYYTRVSESLSHKNRAVTRRDFEQLILQRFPEIYNVRCITPTQCPGLLEPGKVIIMVVPLVVEPTNLSEFQASSFILDAIAKFIKPLASPDLEIEVRNPMYEELVIKCDIMFTEQGSDGYFLEELDRVLSDFISPWMTNQETQADFAKGIQKDVLLGLIQRQDFVKFVTDFSVIQIFSEDANTYGYFDTADTNADFSMIKPSTPWSVLVSLNNHQINVVSEEQYQQADELGISDMVISTDFIIGDHPEMAMLGAVGSGSSTDENMNYVLVLDKNF